MDWFSQIKKFYDDGDWTKERVKIAGVAKGKITPEQYTEITREPYEEEPSI
ncbi:XkdX family protein [Bacillus subtilis]|uniref:XkdX family protein n=1 Tax=Bacillus sp. SG20033 TaxID=3366583 RepID=UPI0037C8F009|nr:XkdX family protein [Bacillus subtilis]